MAMEQPLLVASKARVDITQKYDLKAEVGEGTYGLVYQAEQKGKQTKVAIKKFRSTKEGEGVSFSSFSPFPFPSVLHPPPLLSIVSPLIHSLKFSFISKRYH
jgi:hypothetical protein